MSTKMYNYRLSKEQWWPFAKACRECYHSEHPMAQVLHTLAERGASWRTMLNAVDSIIDDEWTVDLQLFDEGDAYIIRPLERGCFFMNNADQWLEFGIERVYYDTRSDVPPEDEKNRAVAEWVDEKINSGEFLVFSVLNRHSLESICIDKVIA